MTSTRQELDSKVIHWAADTLAMPFPFQDAYIANCNAASQRVEQRRDQVRLMLQSGGLSSLACFSKKELRLLYDSLSGIMPTVHTHHPLKRSALKGQIVQQLSTLLTDPTVIQSIPTRPSLPQGNGHRTAPALSQPVPVPTSTQVPTPTMHHHLAYPYPFPTFLSPPFSMPMPMLPSLPAPTLQNSLVRQPMSAQTPLPRQLPLSPASASRKRKTPSNESSSSSPQPLPNQSAFSPPRQTNFNPWASGPLTGTQPPHPPIQASFMANPPLPSNNDNDNDNDNESIEGTDDGINDPTNDATTSDPTDLFWIHQLRVCGFQDEREIRHALQQARQEQQQDDPITLETLICAIITAREDSALARDMDEARRQSEMEHQQEQQRLSNQRTEETRQRLLNASLHELLHPPPLFSKLFFPRSWLLRHPPLQSLLEDITLHHMDIKKELIQLLQLEKNAFRWYSHGIAKSYYTHHLTKVLGDLEISLVAHKLQEICHQINEGHALMSKQNSSGIPLLYIQAQTDKANEL